MTGQPATGSSPRFADAQNGQPLRSAYATGSLGMLGSF